MPTPAVHAFVESVRQNRLVDDAQLLPLEQLALNIASPKGWTNAAVQHGLLTGYQAQQLLEGKVKSLILGQYVILEPIAEGGMGKVFKARHRLMHRVVALKVIRPELLTTPTTVQRFQREIRAVAQLNHPNIVAAHDADQIGATHFYVMEFVEGVDLHRLVEDRGPLSIALACDYARQVALGLQHAYEKGMVHRDLKPQNLLLTPDGKVKILDMGLALLQTPDASGHLTRLESMMGTPSFMAPEQTLDAHKVDIRADIYSLGCTLFFLVTGQPPFCGNSAAHVMFLHREAPVPDPRQINSRIPGRLADLIARLLAKNPEHRFQTPAEAAQALGAFCSQPIHQQKSAAGEQKQGPPVAAGLPRWLPILGVVLACLLLGVLAWGIWPKKTTEPELEIHLAESGGPNPEKTGKVLKKVAVPPKEEPGPIEPGKKDPPKKELPTKGFPKKNPDPTGKNPFLKKETPVATGAFPRRALLISVSNYLLLNPLSYGTPEERDYPGSSTAALAQRFTLPPLNMPANQVFELSDGAKEPSPVVKPVIETMVMDFCDTSREQDRIVVMFTGHAITYEKKCYLIPVEGNKDDPKTLIPLDWVLDRLAKSKARQKLLILDVFRYPPARGEELPGTGAMTEEFETALLNPPAGVQVWWSASKDQQSVEFEGGSVFLQALSHALKEWNAPGKLGGAGFAQPQEALLLDALLPMVNQRMKELLSVQKVEQASRLSGKEAEGGKAYDKDETLATAVAPKLPNLGADGAGKAVIENILNEINLAPPAKATLKPIQFASLPMFRNSVLQNYKTDYTTLRELKDQVMMYKEKYPLRAAILETVEAMNKDLKVLSRDRVSNPITDALKKTILFEQNKPGLMISELTQKVAALKELQDKRDSEPSKRWQAHYDYTMARLQARIVYIYEYNYMLAYLRNDSLPELDPKIHNGWRIGNRNKISVPASEAKDMAKSVKKLWKKIQDDYPDTSWALMAARESMVALGMEWRPTRE